MTPESSLTDDVGVSVDEKRHYNVYEETTHSFVVKVWVDYPAGATQQPVWRGRITHVMSNRTRSIRSLEGIAEFISDYLEACGVKRPFRQRLSQWLRRARR